MDDFKNIEHIRDVMIESGIDEPLAYSISYLAFDRDEGYELMLQWYKYENESERDVLLNKIKILLY